MDDKSGRLKKKRGVTRTSVTKICKAIETELTKTDVNVDALEEMLEQLAVESNELKKLDSQIEEFVSDDKLEKEVKEVAEYTQKIITWKFRATKKIRERTKNVDSLNVPSSCYKESSSNIKLPKLSISKFYGQSSLWLSFWNSFESAIHENDSLSEVSKFNYLKAHLGGSALSTIEGFALTPENYEIAIKLLKERFGRSDVLINTHLNNLLRICPLKNSDDIVSFRKIEVYLQTLIVSVENNDLKHYVRSIIDLGSQRSYVSKYVADVMKLKCVGEQTVTHGLFGGLKRRENHKKYSIELRNTENNFSCNVEVMDQNKICTSLPKLKDPKNIEELKQLGIFASDICLNENLCLYENDPKEIHILLGADTAARLFTGEIKNLSPDLIAMNTKLGWTVIGRSRITENDSSSTLMSLLVNDLNISDLWRLDTLNINDPAENQSRKELEEAAKEHFERSVKRDNEGRYIVSLPWIHDHPPLPDGRKIAERRLNSCIKALERAEKLVDYDDVFQDWQKEGIIEEVDPMQEIKQGQHFLPHHPVFKENSTTKVRPVFDGSAKERNTPSINDCLEKGPNLVELIPCLMNRFRVGKYGVIADIKKAFLQIGLQERDRPYLRFLWKDRGREGNIKILQHKRVVFGISSSPFLLGATLELHLKNAPDHLKETAQQLMRSFYVDNCVFSVNTKKEL
ncbi:hypothetical protein AVEN_242418-1, partial [Araneus ventricosus]